MSRFLRKLLFFLAPLSLLLLPLGGLWYCQEIFVNLKALTRSEERYVFGLAYSDVGRQFKFLNVREKDRFDVLALGSSRVMQFRKEMFSQRFYNAGGAVQQIDEYESFLKTLPREKLPRLLILGLDQWMFNSGYRDNYKAIENVSYWTDVDAINSDIDEKMKMFIKDACKGKIKNLTSRARTGMYGVNAVSESNGFRTDGSYFYHGVVQKLMSHDTTYADFGFKDTLRRIKRGCCRFNYGEALDHSAIGKLKDLLAFCKTNQIEVIAFLPPFANAVFQRMNDVGKYGYLKRIYPEINPVFEKYGYELYDFSDMAMLDNLSDEEMIDGFHGGEVVYSKVLTKMIESGSKLSAYTDADRLRLDVKGAQNDFVVYRY